MKWPAKNLEDLDMGIDRNDYRQGLTLFGFNMDPTADPESGQRGHSKKDLLTISLNFRSPTPELLSLIVYGLFDDLVTIDSARVVRLAYLGPPS